jgi:hypothetical protein
MYVTLCYLLYFHFIVSLMENIPWPIMDSRRILYSTDFLFNFGFVITNSISIGRVITIHNLGPTHILNNEFSYLK